MPVYHEEEIDEPIGEVVARFSRGRIDPLSFRWRTREHRVHRVNAYWVDRNTQPTVHSFTVTVDTGDIYELAYREGDPIWRLERVFVE